MHRNIAFSAGRWSARHRRKAILGWLAFVFIAFFVGKAVGFDYLSDVEMGNGQSQRADRAIERANFPEYAVEQVLVQGRGPVRLGDSVHTAAVRDVMTRLERVPYVYDVQSPLRRGQEGLLSKDGRSALLEFKLRGTDDQLEDRIDAPLATIAAAQRANPSVSIEEFGDASADKAIGKSYDDDFRKAEITSVPITLLVLLVAFGSLVAAGVPLLLGLTAVIGALGLLGPVSHVIPVGEEVSSVVLLIGLAVGVDYSLFYMRRKLEERDAGYSTFEALTRAASTSGRAVLLSGLTVMVAMAGMLFAGNAVFTSFGIGTILVVAVAILGSLTVLPAVLAALGDNVEKGRVPFIAKRRHNTEGGAWTWVLDRVLRRPALSLTLGTALLIAVSIPALGMKTISPGLSGVPAHLEIKKTYDRIQAAFPGGPLPAAIVISARDVTTPQIRAASERMVERALATGRMSEPVSTTVSPDKTVAVVAVALAGSGTDKRSEAALASLRDDVIPATVGKVPGTETYVTGLTAASKDFTDVMGARLPFVIAFVLGVAFLLLLTTFRSIVVPLVAICLNMLSVGAAYGVVKLIFQDGNLESVLGFKSIGGVITWLPVFLFVVLFGLSMDYHVFILSRIREGVIRGRTTADAVRHGIRSTAGVVTSAAVVMVAVFGIFATLSAVEFKQLGVALGVAVLVDATIVRAVLLPSAMTLLGEHNWYLPRWLDWLPRFTRPAPAAAAPTAAGTAPLPPLPEPVAAPSSSDREHAPLA